MLSTVCAFAHERMKKTYLLWNEMFMPFVVANNCLFCFRGVRSLKHVWCVWHERIWHDAPAGRCKSCHYLAPSRTHFHHWQAWQPCACIQCHYYRLCSFCFFRRMWRIFRTPQRCALFALIPCLGIKPCVCAQFCYDDIRNPTLLGWEVINSTRSNSWSLSVTLSQNCFHFSETLMSLSQCWYVFLRVYS